LPGLSKNSDVCTTVHNCEWAYQAFPGEGGNLQMS